MRPVLPSIEQTPSQLSRFWIGERAALEMAFGILAVICCLALIWGGVRHVGLQKGVQYLLIWVVIALAMGLLYQVAGPSLGF